MRNLIFARIFFTISVLLLLTGCSKDQDEIQELQATTLQTPIGIIDKLAPPPECSYINFQFLWIDGWEDAEQAVNANYSCTNFYYLRDIRFSNAQECYKIGYDMHIQYIEDNGGTVCSPGSNPFGGGGGPNP